MKNKYKLTQSHRLIIATSLSLLGLASYLINAQPVLFGYAAGDVLLIAGALLAGFPIAKNALSSLRYKIVGIDLLVSVAIVCAVIIGEHWEAAAVAILFTFGHLLEARALNKTRSALKALVDEIPDTAFVERDGKLVSIEPKDVQLGEIVVVKSGQKIPVDGIVADGNASVSQAAITGESMPVDKKAGDQVYSGSIVSGGFLRVTADKVGSNTLFASIIDMVEEAQDKKAKTQAYLEKFSTYYTPGIMLLAIVVYFITKDMYLSLTLLVIACPGALVVAAPVSMVAGIGNAARRGILVKGGEAVENSHAVNVIAFDKTGTLTEGTPTVSAVKTFGTNKQTVLELAASAEYYSEHPIGVAIVNHARDTSDVTVRAPKSADILTGLGVKMKTTNGDVLVGNQKLLTGNNITLEAAVQTYIDTQQQDGHTTTTVTQAGKVIGVISVTDQLRPGVKQLVQNLTTTYGKRVVMLTGDNEVTAKSIAHQAGITEFYGSLLPADKLEHIATLQKQYGKVMMVGDGVNDAPALAAADVGVAIEGLGKDVAMDTADVVLLSGGVTKLGYLIPLSRAVVRNMKTNIYFAVGLVALLLVGVLTENVIMSFGMLIHIISVILVTMNASRLIRYKAKTNG